MAAAAEDLRITMPPVPMCFDGLAVAPLMERAFGPDRDGDWRLVPTMANRHADGRVVPARPGRHRVPGLQVRRAAGRGRPIAEITTFGPQLFEAFGLPLVLPEPT